MLCVTRIPHDSVFLTLIIVSSSAGTGALAGFGASWGVECGLPQQKGLGVYKAPLTAVH